MIQMLKLVDERTNPILEKYRKIENLEELEIIKSDLEKVFILAEQLVFSKYLLMINPTNSIYKTFKQKCVNAILNLPKYSDNEKYQTYRNNLYKVVQDFDNKMNWSGVFSILNQPSFESNVRQLPKEFFEPFLFSLSDQVPTSAIYVQEKNKDYKISESPLLIFPKIYRIKNKLYATFETSSFSTFSYSYDNTHYNNETEFLNYLSRFNWTGKETGDILITLARLKNELHNKETTPYSTAYSGIMNVTDTKIRDSKDAIATILTFMKNVSNLYKVPYTDTKRLGHWLNQFDSYSQNAINYFMEENPTLQMKKEFDLERHFNFLSKNVEANRKSVFSGLEAADDQEDPEVEEDETSTTEIETTETTSTEESSSEDITDDFGSVDETGDEFNDTGDDTSSDFGNTGSSDEATGAEQETDTQTEDPNKINFKILIEDPALDIIAYRHRVANALRRFIKNPPTDISTETLTSLTAWLTQWLYIAAPSMIKKFVEFHLINNGSKL